MSPKWFVFILMAWVAVALLVGVVEHTIVGGGTVAGTDGEAVTSVLNDLMTSKTVTAPTLGAKFTTSFTDGTFWEAIGHMMLFDFPAVFHGGWVILQWLFFMPFCIGFGLSLMITLVRGVGSG